MKKIFILLPLYNDWRSLIKLINNIKIKIKKKIIIKMIIVNDGSHEKFKINFKKNKFISQFKIIDLKKNIGHDRAIIMGLYYLIEQKVNFDSVITLDSDGEDDPKYLSKIINISLKDPNHVVICKRVKRSEKLTFKLFYYIFLLLMFIFTYKWLNIGGYNLIPKKIVFKLLESKIIWGNYSAALEKLEVKKKFVDTKRSRRYFLPSQTSFLRLFFHALTIMSAYKEKIIISMLFYSFLIYFFLNKSYLLLNILIFIFCFFIFLFFILSFREKKIGKKIFLKIFFIKKK